MLAVGTLTAGSTIGLGVGGALVMAAVLHRMWPSMRDLDRPAEGRPSGPAPGRLWGVLWLAGTTILFAAFVLAVLTRQHGVAIAAIVIYLAIVASVGALRVAVAIRLRRERQP